MFNAVSKTSFTVAVACFVAGIGTAYFLADRVGFGVLWWIAATAAAIGLAVFWLTPRDPVVPVSPEVEQAASRTIDVSDLPTGSPWPLVGAAALGLLGVGAALGTSMIVMGLIVAAIATAAWLGQVWTEHPSWTQDMTDRINDRFVVPIGLPATIIVLAGIAVVSLSRIFLTVSADAAPIIASVVAFIVLGAFYLLSIRENVGRPALAALVTVSSILVVGSGVAGALRGEREFHEAGGGHGEAISLHASDLAFDQEEMHFPPQSAVAIEFVNEDVAPHNWSLYESKDGDPIFQGQNVEAGEEILYEFETPAAGTYYFQCDLHPTMNGPAEVAADSSEHPEPAGAVPATTSTTEGS